MNDPPSHSSNYLDQDDNLNIHWNNLYCHCPSFLSPIQPYNKPIPFDDILNTPSPKAAANLNTNTSSSQASSISSNIQLRSHPCQPVPPCIACTSHTNPSGISYSQMQHPSPFNPTPSNQIYSQLQQPSQTNFNMRYK